MKRLIVLGLAAVAVAFAAAPAANAAAPIKECGDYSFETGKWTYNKDISGAYIANLTTRKVSCHRARLLATSANGMGTFKCKALTERWEYADMRCTRKGGQVIRYQTGA